MTVSPILVQWEWSLQAEPSLLWPLVSDTNRLNRLVGLAPVAFRETIGPDGGVVRSGAARQLGWPVRWREHPFAWSAPERFSVLRTFEAGPLREYRCAWRLIREGGGTRLVQTLSLVPRHAWLRPVIRWELARMRRAWTQTYLQLDAYLTDAGPHPGEPPARGPLSAPFAAKARQLEAALLPVALVKRLVAFVAGASDVDVQYIRPFVLADRWNASRREVLELCLHAASCGLLIQQWSVLCPHCRGPKAGVARLADLPQAALCQSCNLEFSGSFEQSTELSFKPHPALREVSDAIYCVGGPGATPHIVFQGLLDAHEVRPLALAVETGVYRVRSLPGSRAAEVLYLATPEELDPAEIVLTHDGIQVPAEPLGGPLLVANVCNEAAVATPVVIERVLWDDGAVTAAYVTTLPLFQKLFPTSAPAPGREHALALLAFLACGPADPRLLPDLAAFITERGGAIADIRADALLACFFDPLDCVETGLALLRGQSAEDVGLRLAVDAGACQAFGQDGQLKYGGPAVLATWEALEKSQPGDLMLGAVLATDPGVELLLGGMAVTAIAEGNVVRVTPA